jgi:hypothetical protein
MYYTQWAIGGIGHLGSTESGIVATYGNEIANSKQDEGLTDLLQVLRALVGLAREVRRMEPPCK